MAEYQRLLSREIGSRLDAKCDKLSNAVAIDDIGTFKLLISLPSSSLGPSPFFVLVGGFLSVFLLNKSALIRRTWSSTSVL